MIEYIMKQALNSLFIRVIAALFMSLLLSACVTFPGHRQVVDEGDFYLLITAPNKEMKESIRFSADQTELEYMPNKTAILLKVTDENGLHNLAIKSLDDGTLLYKYQLNGKATDFTAEQRAWLASYIHFIIEKTQPSTSD